jgi:hypothetical protein
MSYWHYLVATPLFWMALSGFFTGASVSRISRLSRRAGHRLSERRRWQAYSEAARSRGWVLFFLGLTVACLLALGAVFVPGPELIVDSHVPWTFGVSALLFFLMFRFKRSFGIPMLVIIAAGAVLLSFALSPWTIADSGAEILQFRVLSTGQSGQPASVEILRPAGLSPSRAFRQIEGSTLQPAADILLFDPFYFFLGGTLAYRNADPGGSSSSAPVVPPGNGFPGAVARTFLANVDVIPGIRSVRARTEPFTPFPLKTYTVTAASDGTLTLSATGTPQ